MLPVPLYMPCQRPSEAEPPQKPRGLSRQAGYLNPQRPVACRPRLAVALAFSVLHASYLLLWDNKRNPGTS